MTPAERLRQHQRTLQKAQRELDRERGKLEQQVSIQARVYGMWELILYFSLLQEKKLMADIKKSAKAGQMVSGNATKLHPRFGNRYYRWSQSAAKIQAKDLVRTRRYIQKFTQMRVQLQAVSLRMQALRSNEQMAVAMRGATKV